MHGPRDVVCLCHLRWGFTFQRPNHLMARFARERRVLYVEEPIFAGGSPRFEVHTEPSGVRVCVPHLPQGLSTDSVDATVRTLLQRLLVAERFAAPIVWLYSPMLLPWVNDLERSALVYDCMDELSLFAGAPPELHERERRLLASADLVFTGGYSLYEAKRDRHPAVFPFPSSVDADHFGAARKLRSEPADQLAIPRPRLGFFGVLDERLDTELLAQLADARPEYHIVMVGPRVKIAESSLPRRPNIHYLGPKSYAELPDYLAGWDVALMPFALNDATRFISPTKTLEYLAAHKAVVSTAIKDVVTPYGETGLVSIADAPNFAAAVDGALGHSPHEHAERCDAVLARTSWDRTFSEMSALLGHFVPAPRAAHKSIGGEPCTTT